MRNHGRTVVSIWLENCFISFLKQFLQRNIHRNKILWIIIYRYILSFNKLSNKRSLCRIHFTYVIQTYIFPPSNFVAHQKLWRRVKLILQIFRIDKTVVKTCNNVSLQRSLKRKPAQLAHTSLSINKTRERFYCLEEPIVTRSYAMKESRHAYKRKHRSAVLVKTWKLCEPLNNRTYHAERSLMSAGKEQLNLGRDIALPLHRGSRSFSRSSFFLPPLFVKKERVRERERVERIPAQWSKFDYKGERCRGEDWSFQLNVDSHRKR